MGTKEMHRGIQQDFVDTKWGVKPTSTDKQREARKEEKAVMGKKDADELEKLRVRAKKDKIIGIKNLQRIQREQDAERLKEVPDARTKLKSTADEK